MATAQRHNDEEEEAQIPKTEFETSSEVESDKKAERSTTKLDKQAIPKVKSPNLTKEEKTIRDSYFYCCQNFFTLPEMIDYMKVNHGLPKTTVTNVFRELLTGRNGEAYLRASQRRGLQRSSNGTTSGSVGSSSSTK
ncbi:hypothetical protein HID58_063585 [Brassica napus]|uniref:Uncharacterized protein n=2 Tax=Brassica TaxID=3705 RepID=A0ABQ8A4M1_BRANA|nr:hypothetical protein HID58_063585 [Brassica napus]